MTDQGRTMPLDADQLAEQMMERIAEEVVGQVRERTQADVSQEGEEPLREPTGDVVPDARAAARADAGSASMHEQAGGVVPAAGDASSAGSNPAATDADGSRNDRHADPRTTAAYLDAFFSELDRCGVRDVVVSPGSRSTPLACKALEHFGDVYVDVDERSAAFFALGLAKAIGGPVAVVCTSGSAVGNWMPAVLEAEAARVPLLLLSADRPERLQNVAAAQTCDQKHLFGPHVKGFYQMPAPARDDDTLAYARQVALDACVLAHGAMPGAASCDAGPVHLNFPFDEPLKPATTPTLPRKRKLPPTVVPGQMLYARDAEGLAKLIKGNRTFALCGEGSCNNEDEARALIEFAHMFRVPLLADPLSGLRSSSDALVIDAYDAVYRAAEAPGAPQVVVRFGRWPVSKALREAVQAAKPVHLAVDLRDARDASTSTTTFVHTTPVAFARGLVAAGQAGDAKADLQRKAFGQAAVDVADSLAEPYQDESAAGRALKGACAHAADAAFAAAWINANEEARSRIAQVQTAGRDDFEGSYIDQMLSLIPEYSLLYVANSMAIRAIDTFYQKRDFPLSVFANRGLAGIDGTLSSAIGAACAYEQTTVLMGDLAFLHDANALHLQHELFKRAERAGTTPPSVVVVVMNNNGGAIFDMLPQKTPDESYERLFYTPHNTILRHIAQAFSVNFREVGTVAEFRRHYALTLGVPGISVIEIKLPLEGVTNRYAPYWGI